MALTNLSQITTSGISTLADVNVNNITGVAATFTGNVTVGGTLTYDDVTNIDSVGLITARSGVSITGGQLTLPDAIVHAGNDNAKIRFPADDTVTVETGGNERLRIDSSGRIGINHTPSGADGILNLKVDGTNVFHLGHGTNKDNYFTCGTSGIQVFRSAGTERLRITAAGDVGIGYDSPTVKLHVREAASGFSGTYDNRYHIICENDDEAYLGFYVPDNQYAGIRFHDTTGLEGSIDYYFADDAMHFYSTAMHIFKTGGTERLRIDSAGGHRIQCSESWTAANLAECNTTKLAFNINKTRQGQTKGIALGSIGSSGGSTGIQAYDTSNDSANPLIINPFGGYVAINDTVPDAQLHVKGAGNSTGLAFLTQDSSSNNTFWILDGGKVGVHYYPFAINRDYNDTIPSNSYFYVHSASQFVIKNDGKVGIGLDDPDTHLTIKGTTDGVLNLDTTDGRGTLIRFKENGTTKVWVGCAEGMGGGLSGDQDDLGLRATGNIFFSANGAERLRITDAGDMGLGVTDATILDDSGFRELMIGGATEGAAIHLQDADGNVKFGAFTSDASNAAFIRTVTNHPIAFRTNNIERLRITENNPESEIELYSGYTDGNYAVIRGKYSSSNEFNRSEVRFGVEANATGSGFLALATGTNSASERLRIKANGTVQFTPEGATSSPNASFDTSGDFFQINTKKDGSGGTGFVVRTQNGGVLGDRLRINLDGRMIFGEASNSNYASASADVTVRSANPELCLQADANYSTYLMMGDVNDYDNGYIEYDNYSVSKGLKFIVGTTKRLDMSVSTVALSQGMGVTIDGGTSNQTSDATVQIDKQNNNDWALKVVCSSGTSTDYGAYVRSANSASYALGVQDTSTWQFRVSGAGTIYATNTTVASISDVRLKENIVDANSQWDDIKALRFRNYKWKEDSGYADGKTYLGLIAQEVETISPGLVDINAQTKEDKENGVPDPEHKNVKYSVVWMKAMKALQEAMERIETLEAEVKALKG